MALLSAFVALLAVVGGSHTAGSERPVGQPSPGAAASQSYLPLVARPDPSYRPLYVSRNLAGHALFAECNPGGGTDVSLTITTESLATWPQADCRDAFAWTVWFRNLGFGSLDG